MDILSSLIPRTSNVVKKGSTECKYKFMHKEHISAVTHDHKKKKMYIAFACRPIFRVRDFFMPAFIFTEFLFTVMYSRFVRILKKK